MATKIDVVAAVIMEDGKYFICQRPEHKRHGGLWEFPGGKINTGESFRDALARELHEELSLNLMSQGKLLYSAQEEGSQFCIHFIEVSVSGKPELKEHQKVLWATTEELAELSLAPTDAEFVKWMG